MKKFRVPDKYYLRVPELVHRECAGCVFYKPRNDETCTHPIYRKFKKDAAECNHVFIPNTPEGIAQYTKYRLGSEKVE